MQPKDCRVVQGENVEYQNEKERVQLQLSPVLLDSAFSGLLVVIFSLILLLILRVI